MIQWLLLAGVVLSCWLGVAGMWRMPEPMQSLHYLSIPATVGAILLVAAVFLSLGVCGASLKAVVITGVLLISNSVVTHATSRAFRARELGHWEPLDSDAIEKVTEETP